MSLDPNKLTNSSGLEQAKKKSQQVARNVAKRQAQKALRNRLKKYALKGKIKGAAKKAAQVMIKVVSKVLIKGLVAIFGGITTIKLIAFGLFAFCVIFLGIFFLAGDFRMTGNENDPEMLALFESVSMTTIDASRPEQHEWRVPESLIASMVMTAGMNREEQGRDIYHYRAISERVVAELKSQFTYEEFTLLSEEYSEQICIYYENCDENGGNCDVREETTVSEATEFERETVEKITNVDTWRGIYTLSYTLPWRDWYVRDVSSSGDCTITYYQKDQDIQEDSRDYSREFNRITNKFNELGFGTLDVGLTEAFFNEVVSSSTSAYTQRNPIDLSYFTGLPGAGRTGMAEGAPIPPEFLQEEYVWPVPTISRISSAYGGRTDPFTGVQTGHRGMDMSNGYSGGHNVYAMAAGRVTKAGPAQGFGQAVYINHENGMVTRYGHMQWDAYGVRTGDRVEKGDYIGQIGYGKIGRSTGSHLHFEVIVNGVWHNPINFVRPLRSTTH